MRSFFKTFFAAFLAMVVFVGLIFLIAIIMVAGIAADKEVTMGKNAVLVIDLSDRFAEIEPSNPLSEIAGQQKNAPPSLSKLVRLLHHAKSNGDIKGLYIKAEENNNDFGSSDEIRDAIIDFRSSGKFVYAYGNTISQKAYYVANAAERIYCNPAGGLEWHGLTLQMPFIKGTLEKLEVEPQIFYAGKFKSATEPLRETSMTEANKVQSRQLLQDIYSQFLRNTSQARNIDTATLKQLADNNSVRFATAAVQHKMIDAARYDDQVKDEIKTKLNLESDAKINFITAGKYAETADFNPAGSDKIAVIYAEGDILDGTGDRGRIGGDSYRNHIRKARMDKSIKAIVLRVNSGGGSSLASEIIWREVDLARQAKPVIVSFGDYAASGGYYIACAADSIFAQPTTITGSIGVFAVIPNMQKFFSSKLGVTFDEVSTSENAATASVTKPLTPIQRQFFQNSIDSIYLLFKTRVANGRNIPLAYVDSIAQGRVWTGVRAVELKLADRLGSLDDAIKAAAAKAELKSYKLREYPGKQSLKEMLFGEQEESVKEAAIKNEIGADGYKIYSFLRDMKQSVGKAQARLPFALIIE